jgi:hypothetical protein
MRLSSAGFRANSSLSLPDGSKGFVIYSLDE